MNKGSIEGAARKTVGQAEEIASRTFKDHQTSGEKLYDQAAGNMQSAYGQAKDAVTQGAKDVVEGLASTDFGTLRDDLAKLTQTVSQLVRNQTASTRDQIMDVAGAAGDNIAQSAAIAQDKLVSFEADIETRVQKNPLLAVALAVGSAC
jgi:uncharacterized protein YjbJ (UPF0337 family)